MAPRAANVGSDALAGTPVAAASCEQHQPGADAPRSAPARAGAAGQEAEEDDDDTVEEMYGRAVREYEGLGTSRISGATSSAAHNHLPAAPPALSVPPLPEDTVASAQPTQPNSSVSGAHAPAALPSLGGGHALTSSSGGASGGGGLAVAHATCAAVPPQEESDMATWRWSRAEVGFDGDLGLEIIGPGMARVIQHVWAPQASVVHGVLARGQQGQAEEGYEEGEEEDDDERGRDVGVALTSVDDEVEFDDDDGGMEDQAAEEAAARVARDQRRNRRLGRAHFTPEEIQSFLPPLSLTTEAAETPSDSSPPLLPAPSATGACPAPVAAPIVPSLGSPLASADPQGFLAAPHPRVPPMSHAPSVDPYDISEHAAPIRAVGDQGLETVPYHSDSGHRAALSDDEVPQVPRPVGRSGFGLPRHHTSGNLFGPAARSGRTDRGRPSSLPDVDTSEEGEKGGKGKKDVAKKSRKFWPSFTGRKGGKGKKKKDRDNEDGRGGLV